MKQKQLRELLHHTNDAQLSRIAQMTPAMDKEIKQRIFRSITEKEDAVEEVYTVTEAAPGFRLHHLLTAAACLAIAVGAAVGIAFLQKGRDTLLPGTEVTQEHKIGEEAAHQMPEKSALYSLCMNSIDHLTQLSGIVCIRGTQATFLLDFKKNVYTQTEYRIMEDSILSIHGLYYGIGHPKDYQFETTVGTVAFDADGVPYVLDAESRTSYWATTDGLLPLPDNPTQIAWFEGLFMPQKLTEQYLSDETLWSITDLREIEGREYAVCTGRVPGSPAEDEIDHWVAYIDTQTGIWRDYEGYARDGTVLSYLHAHDLIFGKEAQEPELTRGLTDLVISGALTQPLSEPIYPTNESAQTYGSLSAAAPGEEPDLIAVEGDSGYFGYVYWTDLDEPAPASPEEAVAIMEERRQNGETSRCIPVYASDGITVIDTFTIGSK